MCGRFELDAKAEVFKKRYKLKRPPAMPNTPEVRPTDLSVVVNGKREAVLLGWGFPSEWDGKPLFNARAETLADKPSVCPYLEQRCIVP
ncbi:MAG: SOS response-associated peptidase, partial [Rhodospirillales bacterium]|nr:SOS response-associated peptidase [Rhodospirillales bacterium]